MLRYVYISRICFYFSLPSGLDTHIQAICLILTQVNVDFGHVERAYSLYCQAHPNLTVVGWYSTNTVINHVSCLINKNLMEKFNCINPVLVTVDTSLQNDQLNITGYTSKTVTVDGKPFHIRFDCVPIETKPFEAERIAIDAIINGDPDGDHLDAPAAIANDTEAISRAVTALTSHFDQVGAYLSQVTENKVCFLSLTIAVSESDGSSPFLVS